MPGSVRTWPLFCPTRPTTSRFRDESADGKPEEACARRHIGVHCPRAGTSPCRIASSEPCRIGDHGGGTASRGPGRRGRAGSGKAARDVPVDGRVAGAWAALRLALRDEGRRMPLNDSWIAATAIAHRIPVVSQDADYDRIPGLEVIRV